MKGTLINADDMMALWNVDGEGRVSELVIVDRRNDDSEHHKQLRRSAGACSDDWMRGEILQTPIGLFAQISFENGFANAAVRTSALVAFAKVEGQGWATDLAAKERNRQDGINWRLPE